MLVRLSLIVRCPCWTRFSNGHSVQQLLFSHQKKVSFIKTSSAEDSGNSSEKFFTFFECLKESWTFWKTSLLGSWCKCMRKMEAQQLSHGSGILFDTQNVCVYFSSYILNIWYFVALASSILFKQRKHKIQESTDLFVSRESAIYQL